jgi:hypothetical protein
MGLIETLVVGIFGIFGACMSKLLADEFKAWAPSLVDQIISVAVGRAPHNLRERLAEEWRSHVNDTPGDLAKLVVAFSFICASGKLRNEAEQAHRRRPWWQPPSADEIHDRLDEVERQLERLRSRAQPSAGVSSGSSRTQSDS